MTGQKFEEPLLKEAEFGMNMAVLISSGLLLQHAAIVQPTTIVAMGMVGGFGRLIKGMAQTIANVQVGTSTLGDPIYARQWAKIAGVLAYTMSKELHDIVMDERTREVSDTIMRSFWITQMDGGARLVGAMVGKMYAIDMAMLYLKKPSPKNRAKLRRLGIDAEKIMQRHLSGTMPANGSILTDAEIRMAALAFTEETNHVVNPLTGPVFMKGHPLFKLFMLFNRFAYQQHHLWKTIIKDSKGKALKGLLAGIVVGAPILLLRMLLAGDDPEKIIERDGIAAFLLRAMLIGAAPGLFAEAFINALMAAFSGNPAGMQTTKRGVDSPIFGVMQTILKGISSTAKYAIGDETTDTDLHNAIKGLYYLVQAGLVTVAPPSIGIPANKVLGIARPALEHNFFPTPRQEEVNLSGRF
jgi:hypothetical protein